MQENGARQMIPSYEKIIIKDRRDGHFADFLIFLSVSLETF